MFKKDFVGVFSILSLRGVATTKQSTTKLRDCFAPSTGLAMTEDDPRTALILSLRGSSNDRSNLRPLICDQNNIIFI
jgi:hypothetical protein